MVSLADLEDIDAPAPARAGSTAPALSDLEEIDAPNNTVLHEKSGRVLSVPPTLSASETAFVVGKDIDGVDDWYGQAPATPEIAMMQIQQAPVRAIGRAIASIPGKIGGLGLEQAEITEARMKNGGTAESFSAGIFGIPKLARDLAVGYYGTDKLKDQMTRLQERNTRWLDDQGLNTEPGDGKNPVAKVMYDIGGVGASLAGTVGGGMILKSAKLPVIIQSAFVKSDAYTEARAKGLNPDEAVDYSNEQFAWNLATESVGTHFIFASMAENTGIKAFKKAVMTEGTQEGGQSFGQDSISNAYGVTDYSLLDKLENAAYSSFLGGLTGGGVATAGHLATRQAKELGLPDDQAQKFGEAVMNNDSIARQDMTEFLDKELAPIAQIDEGAKTFMQVMNNYQNDPSLIDPAQFHGADKELFDHFLKIFNESITQPQSIEAVEKAYFSKLTEAGTPANMTPDQWQEQSVAASKLMGARADAAARAMGITPMEWYQSHNLDVEIEQTPDEAIESYGVELEKLREKAPPVPDEPPIDATPAEIQEYQQRLNDLNANTKDESMKKPLIKYLRGLGGIHPDGVAAQELKHLGITNKAAPGLYRRQETALGDLDRIPVTEFQEATGITPPNDGTYGEYVDRDWLLDALRDEQFGIKVGEQKPVGLDEGFQRALDEAGLDYRTATAEEVYAKLGPDADIKAAASEMGVTLPQKAINQIRGILRDAPGMDIRDAIDDWSERAAIMDEPTLYQSQQTVLPGAEKISDKEFAERKMKGKLKSTKEQKPMDEGMFGDEAKQQTLFQSPSQQITEMTRSVLRDQVNANSNIRDKADFMERAAQGELTESERRHLPNEVVRTADMLRDRMQTLNQEDARGSITFGKNRTLINLFRNADPSTLLHEMGHFFLRDMRKVAEVSNRPMVKQDYEIVKKFLGAKGNKLTEAQEEKFARAFEQYLREGKAPKPELQTVFDRFKAWLSSIYQSAKNLNVEISDDVRRVFDRMLGADYARTEEQVQQRDLQKMQADYERVAAYEPPNTFWQDTGQVFRDISDLSGKALTPVSTRLGKIDVTLKHAVRKFLFRTGLYTHEDRTVVKGFIEKVGNEMSEGDYRRFDLALKNRDTEEAERLIKQYGIEEEWAGVRKTLDELYNSALDVGLDMAYVQDYFPRQVSSDKTIEYLNALRNTPVWTELQLAMQEKDPLGQFTPEEKADFANLYLRGFSTNRVNLARPGFSKARTVDYVTPEFNQYYDDSMQTLMDYIGGLRHGIESRRLFGKSAKDTESNIGSYVLKLIDQGVIKPEQEKELKAILKAVVEPTGPHGFAQWAKNASYIYLMGSPTSAITQIQDLANSLTFNGYYRTLKSLGKSLAGKQAYRKEDLGIDNILQEYEDETRASIAVRKVFKLIGLEKLDRIGKEVYIDAALARLQATNKKGGKAWDQLTQDIFGSEAAQFKKDLAEGARTENVKYMLFSELSDMQPISLAEMPEGYLSGGNYRILYQLKTYTIKQIDIYRNKIFDEIASGEPARMYDGTRNLIHLATSLMLLGMASDELKDLLLGRRTSVNDLVTDNLLKLMAISKYQIYKAKQDGVANAFFMSFVVPPAFAPLNDLRDIPAIIEGKKDAKDAMIINGIPIVGKVIYWWWGGGRTKELKKRAKEG